MLKEDLKKPTFPFIEVAYGAIFFHAIGLNYFLGGLGFIDIPQERLDQFADETDKLIVLWSWRVGFLLFLAASTFQLMRVFMRVLLSDKLDNKHREFGLACAEFRFHSIVLLLHYSLRLGAILLLLFIERSLYNRADITAFFQRWSLVLLVFYCLLIAYSLCVSSFNAYWAKSILKNMNSNVGSPWKKAEESDSAVIKQAHEAYWQSIGWFATDLLMFLAFVLMYMVEGGQEKSTLLVVVVLFFCAVVSILVFVLEWYSPLIEDVKAMLKEYSWIKTGLALVLAFGLWLGAEKWIGSLLI